MKRKMMTKKKILIGSIFAVLLMVSMPLIPALQTQQVATSKTTTSVQPSNPTTTNPQSTNLAYVQAELNKIFAIDPNTATPDQIRDGIKRATDLLKYLGYPDKALEIDQKLQGIIGTAIKCALAIPLLFAILIYYDFVLPGILLWHQLLYNLGLESRDQWLNNLDILGKLHGDTWEFGDKLLNWMMENCNYDPFPQPPNGCSICADTTGSATSMTSN